MYTKRLMSFFSISVLLIAILPAINLLNRSALDGEVALPSDPSQLWSIDSAEGLLALRLWHCCEISLREGDVVVGQNGFLFLGNDHDRVIDKITGRFQPTDREVENWAAMIGQLANTAEQRRAAFMFALAPNKHGVHSEHLPDGVEHADRTMTDRVLAALERESVPIADLRAGLKEATEVAAVYLKTDTHWTKGGAALGYLGAITALQQLGLDVRPLEFQVIPRRGPAGDLARMLKADGVLGAQHEVDQDVRFEQGSICAVAKPLSSPEMLRCDPSAATATASFQNRVMESSYAPDAPNAQRLLLICDSFCEAHRALYQASFAEVHLVHWKTLVEFDFGTQLERVSPDIVVFQLVERALLLPQFKM
ncbi:MAG: hypothetical protein OXC60_15945 [Litoreibacter sp.]|nr:hypothetical protein [Litoreibacter sp.]MCY4336151.1 hypothetical protein [Litoreibacter sp.]